MAHANALVGSGLHDIGDEPQIANSPQAALIHHRRPAQVRRALLSHKLLSADDRRHPHPQGRLPQPGGPPSTSTPTASPTSKINGITFIGHNGGTPGYAGQIDIYPRAGYVVVILTNQRQR